MRFGAKEFVPGRLSLSPFCISWFPAKAVTSISSWHVKLSDLSRYKEIDAGQQRDDALLSIEKKDFGALIFRFGSKARNHLRFHGYRKSPNNDPPRNCRGAG